MFRRPTYRPNGARTARRLLSAFTSLAEKGSWTVRRNSFAAGSRIQTRGNGPMTDAHSVRDARDLVAPTAPEPVAERVAIPCFVVFAPRAPLPAAERSISNEGGIIRFGLDSRDDRGPTVK
jgi:hypothetical protein